MSSDNSGSGSTRVVSDEVPDTSRHDEEKLEAIVANPFQEYIEHLEKKNRGVEYVQQMEAQLDDYKEWLVEADGPPPLGISTGTIIDYHEHLRDEHDQNKRTRYGCLERVAMFYNWLERNRIVSSNPAYAALKELEDSGEISNDSPDRPEKTIREMAEFIDWLPIPWARAIILTHLKTGVRIGELINMDLCTVDLDHPCYERVLERYDVELVDELRGYTDVIYIPSDISVGDEVRGEIRDSSNKRKHDSLIPIDQELKSALLEYILIRPYTPDHPSQAQPFFTTRVGTSNGSPRCTKAGLNAAIVRESPGYLKEYGWWEPGAPTEEKVTSHFFRHYFSHNHKELRGLHDDFLPRRVIKYIRGDAPDHNDALERDYDQSNWDQWERQIKEPYLNSVYQFGTYR